LLTVNGKPDEKLYVDFTFLHLSKPAAMSRSL